jgi:hypothetical protein
MSSRTYMFLGHLGFLDAQDVRVLLSNQSGQSSRVLQRKGISLHTPMVVPSSRPNPHTKAFNLNGHSI